VFITFSRGVGDFFLSSLDGSCYHCIFTSYFHAED